MNSSRLHSRSRALKASISVACCARVWWVASRHGGGAGRPWLELDPLGALSWAWGFVVALREASGDVLKSLKDLLYNYS